MESRHHSPSAAHSWLATCLALLVLVPAASTQGTFAFLQPLPTPVQCQTYAFAWTGGTPTYTLSVSVSLPWNASYGIYPLGGQGFPWVMPVPAGHTVSFELRDNASHVASAGPLMIQPSDDTSCFDSTGTTSSKKSSTATSSTTTSSTTTSSTTTSETPTTTSTTSVTSTSESSSSTFTSTSSPSSAPPSFTPFTASSSSTSQSLATTAVPESAPVIETITAVPTATTTSPSNASPTPRRATLSTGAIAGIAVGGAAVLVLAGVAIWLCRKRKRQPSASFGFGAKTKEGMGPEKSTDSDAISRLRSGGPQMSEAVTSGQRLGPGPHPVPAPSSSSSASARSDPFAAGDGDGSRRRLLFLPTGSEDSELPSSHPRWDGPARSGSASFLSSLPAPIPIDVHARSQSRPLAVDDSITKPPDTALAGPDILIIDPPDPKPDSPPRDLPLPPSHPSRGPERIVHGYSYAAVPTDSGVGAPAAHLMQFEEDGGVRLAGGLPGEVLDADGGWVVQPPPYQRFR